MPFGIVGGRLYHVITSPDAYFGDGGTPLHALYIWQGGLGIWGAIALGGVAPGSAAAGAASRCRPSPTRWRRASSVAQAIGRLGNCFNQELYGRPTDLPWALARSTPAHRPAGYADQATYHPTFLYELLWDLGVAALVVWADRRFRLGHGRAFALYVAAYTVGRGWIEALRIDPAHQSSGSGSTTGPACSSSPERSSTSSSAPGCGPAETPEEPRRSARPGEPAVRGPPARSSRRTADDDRGATSRPGRRP